MFKYRNALSAEDFADLARLQNRLDPQNGQIHGQAPVPDDLVSLCDWLAPDPGWRQVRESPRAMRLRFSVRVCQFGKAVEMGPYLHRMIYRK